MELWEMQDVETDVERASLTMGRGRDVGSQDSGGPALLPTASGGWQVHGWVLLLEMAGP